MSIAHRIAKVESQVGELDQKFARHEDFVAVMERQRQRDDIERRLLAGEEMADRDWQFILGDREQKGLDRAFWDNHQDNPAFLAWYDHHNEKTT